jgi:DNA-binding IclR family transcriptional regulator
MDTKTLISLSTGAETKTRKGEARWPHADFAREKDNLYVGSIEKAICILYAFGKGRPELRLNEIAEITGLGRSAAQRYTHTLCSLGFLLKVNDGPVYRPAPRILDLSFIYLRSDPLVEAATTHLIEAKKAYNETINLGRRQDNEMIFIVRIPGRGGQESRSLPGVRMPVYCTTAGRSILSHLPEDEARDLIMTSDRRPLTTKTITDPDEIMALIRKSSDDGFSLADEEGQMGIITVGSAILDGSGYPVAAVNMAASARSWSVDQVREKLGPLVMETARHISRTQGFSASYHES